MFGFGSNKSIQSVTLARYKSPINILLRYLILEMTRSNLLILGVDRDEIISVGLFFFYRGGTDLSTLNNLQIKYILLAPG